MSETTEITIEEAAQRLHVSVQEVGEYIRHGKLEARGRGAEMRVVWPTTDARSTIYRPSESDENGVAAQQKAQRFEGDFHTGRQKVPRTRRVGPVVMSLWIGLFAAGLLWLYYVVSFSQQLPRTH
jgi:hypothetical protein